VNNDNNDPPGPKSIQDLLPASLKSPGQAIRRLYETPLDPAEADSPILYQHSVLCQTCLPYRDPGDEVRLWSRKNGHARLELQAGRAFDGARDDFVDVGLPFGPKPRLVLYHLNAEALRTQSPTIELEDSLTSFVKRTLGLDTGGRNIRTVKDQLTRLSAADFRIGTALEGRSITLKGSVIEGFELWTARDPRQRVLWPTTVQFSQRYFESLVKHAVPLNETAVARLSHSAMGLDIYTWLAQRLHRVEEGKSAFVPWTALKEQFGHGYGRMDNFKRVYRTTLRQVKAVYPESKFELDDRGMKLRQSRPPVGRRLLPVTTGKS
jgi:hypothetical protein